VFNYEHNQLSVWDNYQSLVVKIDAQSGSVPLKKLAYDATIATVATKQTDLSLQLLADFIKKQPIS
jgi:hypothetical protein